VRPAPVSPRRSHLGTDPHQSLDTPTGSRRVSHLPGERVRVRAYKATSACQLSPDYPLSRGPPPPGGAIAAVTDRLPATPLRSAGFTGDGNRLLTRRSARSPLPEAGEAGAAAPARRPEGCPLGTLLSKGWGRSSAPRSLAKLPSPSSPAPNRSWPKSLSSGGLPKTKDQTPRAFQYQACAKRSHKPPNLSAFEKVLISGYHHAGEAGAAAPARGARGVSPRNPSS
jgi:hypothetical protein